jgi:hypothetical protein
MGLAITDGQSGGRLAAVMLPTGRHEQQRVRRARQPPSPEPAAIRSHGTCLPGLVPFVPPRVLAVIATLLVPEVLWMRFSYRMVPEVARRSLALDHLEPESAVLLDDCQDRGPAQFMGSCLTGLGEGPRHHRLDNVDPG